MEGRHHWAATDTTLNIGINAGLGHFAAVASIGGDGDGGQGWRRQRQIVGWKKSFCFWPSPGEVLQADIAAKLVA
jgi:hypothetical protein